MLPEPNTFSSLEDFQNGVILIVDKPLEWTSFDVVNKLRSTIRKTFNIKKIKVGHAGTLDPLATGVLIICVGKMTKQIQYIMAENKRYEATIELGKTTPSYDAETEVDQTFEHEHVTPEVLNEELKKWVGTYEQLPPLFSAKKVDGKVAYKAARKGKEIELRTAEVTIHELELIDENLPEFSIDITCGKGTYIRSLAFDIGKSLNSGAYLKALRRTASGDFSIEHAKNLDDLVADIQALAPESIH